MNSIPSKIFVTGIGTDVGKTVASAALCMQFEYAYWKPVQCGTSDGTDTGTVRDLGGIIVHDEVYVLNKPVSPHHAARNENVRIELNELAPNFENVLIEGAGGLMVPINDDKTYLDYVKAYNLPVILVSRNYLGSINHTLLSIEVLKSHSINVLGIVINGVEYPEGEMLFEQAGVKIIGRLLECATPEEAIEKFEWYGLD